jgi:hypothetical protein
VRILTYLFTVLCVHAFLNAEIRIGLIGDQTAADDLDAAYQVLAEGVTALNARRPSLVLHTGDLLESVRYPNAMPEDEFRAQFAKATGILSQLNAPWHLAAGDHDVNAPYNQPDETHNRQLFQTLYAPAKERLYHSFNQAGYHFIALSSQEHHDTDPRWGTTFRARLSDEQMAWLRNDLVRNRRARGIVVFLHQPLWYQWANWAPVHELLRQYRVRAVVAGHFHYNQDEGLLDGIRYLVIGATGGMTKHGSAGAGDFHHVSLLTIDGRRLSVEAIPLRQAAARPFSSRRDMDRVQALAVALSNLYSETTVDTCSGKYELQLRSLGNPIDVPLRLRVSPVSSNYLPVSSRFAGVCGSAAECVLPPGLLMQSSNNSSVVPERTQSVWTAVLPAKTSDGKTPQLRITVRAEFAGEREPLHVEQTLTIRTNCPLK